MKKEKEIIEQANKIFPLTDRIPLELGYHENDLAEKQQEAFKLACNWTQQQDNWISVEDTLPKEKTYVLNYGQGGRQFTSFFKLGKFKCYNPFSEELETAELVTHWQPLPNPPNK
jgi:hypothetical protein